MSFRDFAINTFYKAATSNWKVRTLLTPLGLAIALTLMLLFVVASIWFDKFLGLPKFLSNSQSIALGVPIFAIGLFLWLWSNLHFIKAKGTGVPFNPPPRLVTTGPYAHVRNPMLIGVSILLFGLGILLNSISLAFIFTPIFILFNVLELRAIEEPELQKRLGKEYLEYKERVPMFIPGLKAKTKT